MVRPSRGGQIVRGACLFWILKSSDKNQQNTFASGHGIGHYPITSKTGAKFSKVKNVKGCPFKKFAQFFSPMIPIIKRADENWQG